MKEEVWDEIHDRLMAETGAAENVILCVATSEEDSNEGTGNLLVKGDGYDVLGMLKAITDEVIDRMAMQSAMKVMCILCEKSEGCTLREKEEDECQD